MSSCHNSTVRSDGGLDARGDRREGGPSLVLNVGLTELSNELRVKDDREPLDFR